MNLVPSLRRRGLSAFTLVEMLTVVGIITLLIVLATPTLVDVLKATRMTSAGDNLINRLSLAQQEAISRNNEVEMRFYIWADPSSEQPSLEICYAYQLVAAPVNGGDPQAISDPFYLDSGIVLAPEPALSPLLQQPMPQPPLVRQSGQYLFSPRGGQPPASVKYKSLRFYQDGSCRLLTQSTGTNTDATTTATAYTIPQLASSFLTITYASNVNTGVMPPRNYFCIQIDAYTGKARVYRP